MFSGAAPKVQQVLRSILFEFDVPLRACDQITTRESRFCREPSIWGVFSSLACVRWGGRVCFFWGGGFDTKRYERKKTRGGFPSTKFVSVCRFSRKDPSWGVFFLMDGGEWSAETSSSVRGAETLWHTCTGDNRVRAWAGRDTIIAAFAWRRESRQKCCQRQHVGIRLHTGEVLCSLLFVASFSGNNVWFLRACWLCLSNCQNLLYNFFWQPFSTGPAEHLIPFRWFSQKVLRVFYPFHRSFSSSLCYSGPVKPACSRSTLTSAYFLWICTTISTFNV